MQQTASSRTNQYEAADAIARAPLDEQGHRLFTVDELDWFCRNAYNLVVKNMFTWQVGDSLRVVEACLEMIIRYPEDLPGVKSQDLSLKKAFCHFLGASLSLVAARAQDNIEVRCQHYLNTRKHAGAFDKILQEGSIGSLAQDLGPDLNAKLVTLFVFDFEAAIELKAHSDLAQIVRKLRAAGDVAAFQALGDLVLCSKLPADGQYTTVHIFSVLPHLGQTRDGEAVGMLTEPCSSHGKRYAPDRERDMETRPLRPCQIVKVLPVHVPSRAALK